MSPSGSALRLGALQRVWLQNANGESKGRQSRWVVSARGCSSPGSVGLSALGSQRPHRLGHTFWDIAGLMREHFPQSRALLRQRCWCL